MALESASPDDPADRVREAMRAFVGALVDGSVALSMAGAQVPPGRATGR